MFLQFYYQALLTNGYLHFDLSSMTYRERGQKSITITMSLCKNSHCYQRLFIVNKQTNKQIIDWSVESYKEAAILFLDHHQ